MVISGCCEKQFVDRVVEVKVPVKVEIPAVQCYPKEQTSFTGDIEEMRICIEKYKEAIGVYNKK